MNKVDWHISSCIKWLQAITFVACISVLLILSGCQTSDNHNVSKSYLLDGVGKITAPASWEISPSIRKSERFKDRLTGDGVHIYGANQEYLELIEVDKESAEAFAETESQSVKGYYLNTTDGLMNSAISITLDDAAKEVYACTFYKFLENGKIFAFYYSQDEELNAMVEQEKSLEEIFEFVLKKTGITLFS